MNRMFWHLKRSSAEKTEVEVYMGMLDNIPEVVSEAFVKQVWNGNH